MSGGWPRSHQRGAGLLELLIALSLGLILVATLTMQVIGGGRGQRLQVAQAQMVEDAQIALDLLRADFLMAGHAWPLKGQTGSSGQASWNDALAGPALLACDAGFASLPSSGAPSCAAVGGAASSASSAVEVAYEADVYSTVVGSDGRPTDCLGNSIVPTVLSDGRRVYLAYNRWQISSSGGRTELRCGGRGTSSPQPLVDQVERLVLTWGLPVDASEGTALRYVSASELTDFSQVRAVRVCLQMRSPEAVLGPQDARTYRDCNGLALLSSDGRLRRSFHTTVAWRHLRAR